MVPPASVDSIGVRSLTSIGTDGVIWSGFGAEAGADFWVVLVCFLIAAGFEDDFDGGLGGGGSTTTPLGPTGRRSSSTTAEVSVCCHWSMAPSRVGVAWNCSTGGGAAPAETKASGDRPAERPWALSICTRYASRAAGSTVRTAGSSSVALVRPGGTGSRATWTQTGAGGEEESVVRQTSAVIGPLM